MCGFLLIVFALISASAAMSQATTTRCFPQSWISADQVKVSCNSTQIAQYCDPDQSCRNVSKPGVSLEKGIDGVCLTITNCSYDSSSCEAQSYISGKEHRENFTVNVCHHAASPSPTPPHEVPPTLLPDEEGDAASPSPTPPHEVPPTLLPDEEGGSFEAVWGQIILGLIILGLIIFGLIIFGLIIFGLIIFGRKIEKITSYEKLKCFGKAIRDIFCHLLRMNRAPEEEQDIELEEEGEKFLESLN